LHLHTVRYLAHAGSDVETAYRSPAEIAADRARDPLVALAKRLGVPGLAQRYEDIFARVEKLATDLADTPTLTSAEQIMAPLAPRAIAPDSLAQNVADPDTRAAASTA
jgi:2-oxoisovalerate dehydrogenase E1 component